MTPPCRCAVEYPGQKNCTTTLRGRCAQAASMAARSPFGVSIPTSTWIDPPKFCAKIPSSAWASVGRSVVGMTTAASNGVCGECLEETLHPNLPVPPQGKMMRVKGALICGLWQSGTARRFERLAGEARIAYLEQGKNISAPHGCGLALESERKEIL
jgi:hypothetical protein